MEADTHTHIYTHTHTHALGWSIICGLLVKIDTYNARCSMEHISWAL